MKKSIRIISLLLALLMCGAILIGCKSNKGDEETGTKTTVTTGELTDAQRRALEKDNLPEWVNTKFQGRTIQTYSFKENYELDANGYGEITGDTVYDLVYQRNKSVEERLGITLENVVSTTSSNYEQYGKELSVMAGSGSSDYPIIYTMGNSAKWSGVEHIYFADVTQFEYSEEKPEGILSLNSAWWRRDAMEAQSFDGKQLRYLCGDITITTYNKAGAIFVNYTEYNNLYQGGLDELYDLVISGGWTIEVLSQKAKENYTDVYDDGLDDDGRDFIGYGMGSYVRVKALEYGFDVRRWSRDENGFVKVDVDLERADVAVDALIELLFENPGVYFDNTNYLFGKSFAKGSMLFYENQLGTIMGDALRNMEEDFGVLPTPKLDTNQKDYMTEIQESSSFIIIPVTCPDTEFATVVIEALCTESYRTVILPYLEECLKIQYVRESRAGQNIDIILASATKDYFGLNNPGGMGKLITSTVEMETNRLASNYTNLLSKAEGQLNEIKTKYYS